MTDEEAWNAHSEVSKWDTLAPEYKAVFSLGRMSSQRVVILKEVQEKMLELAKMNFPASECFFKLWNWLDGESTNK